MSLKVIIPPSSVGFLLVYPPMPLFWLELATTGVIPFKSNKFAFVSLYAFVGCISNRVPNLTFLYAHAFSFEGRGQTIFPGHSLL